jgi:NAD(P) transhydrogenase subunit alpha
MNIALGISLLAEAGKAATETAGSDFGMLATALTIFVLAVFVGVEVIVKVPPTLHTPLMSGSNAISGITLVGALLCVHASEKSASVEVLTSIFAFLAVTFATINVVGGFLVTHRMLGMFKKK